MKTKIISLILLLAALPSVHAQSSIYGTYTNLNTTNFFAASATYTYSGSNYLDVTRNTQIAIQFEGSGAGTTTNAAALTFTYQMSRDATNWFTAPFALVWGSLGTTRAVAGTNIDVGAFGYVRPYQIVNATAMNLTNCTLSAIIKGYRRDQ